MAVGTDAGCPCLGGQVGLVLLIVTFCVGREETVRFPHMLSVALRVHPWLWVVLKPVIVCVPIFSDKWHQWFTRLAVRPVPGRRGKLQWLLSWLGLPLLHQRSSRLPHIVSNFPHYYLQIRKSLFNGYLLLWRTGMCSRYISGDGLLLLSSLLTVAHVGW